MVGRRESTPEEMAASRNSRVAARQLERQERYVALLRQAKSQHQIGDAEHLDRAINQGDTELHKIRAAAGGRIMPRRRPTKSTPESSIQCRIYLDECGSHSLGLNDGYDVFVLGAVIIKNEDHLELDRLWKAWKSTTLGSIDRKIHEPDVRKGSGSFWFGGDYERRSEARSSLDQILLDLDFGAVVCVINRSEYLAQVGNQALDNSLPSHPYLMSLDFLMERLVMVLESQYTCSRARVVAEARGPVEDAMLQAEFVRLLLDGTSYVSAQWFRQQLEPGIEFQTKDDNNSGLQIADLLVRPCGDKVLSPSSTPDRWPVFRTKLCLGRETAHSILGLKIVPWDDKYIDIWQS